MASQLPGQTFAEWMRAKQGGGGNAASASPTLPTVHIQAGKSLPGQSFGEWYASRQGPASNTPPVTGISAPIVNGAPGMGDLQAAEAATPASTISEWHPSFWQKAVTDLKDFSQSVKAGFGQEAARIFDRKGLAQAQKAYAGLSPSSSAYESEPYATYRPANAGERVGQFIGGTVADLPFFAAADAVGGPVAGVAGRILPELPKAVAPLAEAALRGGLGGAAFGAGTEAIGGGNLQDVAKEAGTQAATWAGMGVGGSLLGRLGKVVFDGLRNVPTDATTREIDAAVDAATSPGQTPNTNTKIESPGAAQITPLSPGLFRLPDDPTKIWYSMDSNGFLYQVKHGEVALSPDIVYKDGQWQSPSGKPLANTSLGTKGNLDTLERLLRIRQSEAPLAPGGDQQPIYMHAGILPKWVQDMVNKYMSTGLAELFHQYPGMPKEDVAKVQATFMGQLRSSLEDLARDYTDIMRRVNPDHDLKIDREIAYQIDDGKFTDDAIGRAARGFADLIAKYTKGEALSGKVLPPLRTTEIENYIHRIPKDYGGTEPVGWAQFKASRTPERNFRKPTIGGAAKSRTLEDTMRNIDAAFEKEFHRPFYEHNLNKAIYKRLEDSVNAQTIHKLIDDLLAKYTPQVPEDLQVPYEQASAKLTALYSDRSELEQQLKKVQGSLKTNPRDLGAQQARREAAAKLKAVESQLEPTKAEYVKTRDARKAWIEANYPHGYVTKIQAGTSIPEMAMRVKDHKDARIFSYMPERMTKATTLTKAALDKLAAGVPLEITPENKGQFITTAGREIPSSHNFVVPQWMHRFFETGIRKATESDLAHRLNHFMNLVDKWNSLVRRLTVTSPAWHPINMLFELGREPAAYLRLGEAIDALRTKSDIYDRARRAGIFPNMGDLKGRWSEKDKMLDALAANEQHNWRTWQYWRDVYRRQRITHTPFGAALETFLLHPTQAATWKTDAVLRMALFIHNAAKGMPDLENAQAVGDILHLYGRLSPVEREVFSRFFMFYDWMKHVVFEIPASFVKRPLPSLVYLATILAALDYNHVRTDGKHLWEEDTPTHAISLVLGKDAKGDVTYLNPHIPALEPLEIGWEIVKGAPEYFFYRTLPYVRGPIGALAGYYNPFATADKKIPIAQKDLRPGVETVPLWTPVGYSTGQSQPGNPQVNPWTAYWAQSLLSPVSGWAQSIYTKGETPLQKLSRYLGLGYISQANPSATAYENLKTENIVDQNTRTYVLGRGAVESLIEGNTKPLYAAVKQLETMPNPIRVTQKEFSDALNSPKNMSRAINIMLKETNDPVRIQKLKSIQAQVDSKLLIQQLKSLRGNATPQDFKKYLQSLGTGH